MFVREVYRRNTIQKTHLNRATLQAPKIINICKTLTATETESLREVPGLDFHRVQCMIS